ncbi:hypothetical protein Dimus_023349 [Dionaea muscipula]
MELHHVDASSLRHWTSSLLAPASCSTKVLSEKKRVRRKRGSGLVGSPGKGSEAGKGSEEAAMVLRKGTKKELSRILWTEASIKAIESKAGSKKYTNLWPKAVIEALEEAITGYRWESALKIFGLLRKQHWYEPKCRTYTKLLMMLGKCRKPEQASMLFDILLSDGLQPTIDVLTALVNAYGLSGLFDQAFSIIDNMKSVYDCKPDVHTYSTLLNSCIKHRRFDLIDGIFAEMSYLGIECTTVTYNTIIDGYGKAGLYGQMENALSDMIDSGSCVPDIFTLNSFIWAYGNRGQIEKMEKSYEEFQLMGVTPDVRTFNILIRSYGNAGLCEKMESVLDFMKKRFFPPSVVTFNTMIEIYGRCGNIKKMDQLFLKMKHQGVRPNTITYCSLVNAYSKAGKLYKVDSIIQQIENSNVVLDTPFFNCIISAYGRIGDVDKMSELFLAMEEKNCKPDNITFATMIQAYNAQGMTEAALHTQSQMIAMQGNSIQSESRLIES